MPPAARIGPGSLAQTAKRYHSTPSSGRSSANSSVTQPNSKVHGWPRGTLFVTYCAGPHCNGATRGAIRLAQLGRPVKIMIGGVTGWLDEGFELVPDVIDAAVSAAS